MDDQKVKTKTKSKAKLIYRFDDTIPDSIDLSRLSSLSVSEYKATIDINKRITVTHKKSEEWLYFPSTGKPRFLSTSAIREPPTYRTITGEKVVPTRIHSLLTQNPSGKTKRPASTFHDKPQPDEGYYLFKVKEGTAEFIAETRENYYCVPGLAAHFSCPDSQSALKKESGINKWYEGYFSWQQRDVLIYINPANNQAIYYCPKCSYRGIKNEHGKPITHPLPKDLREELEEKGYLPVTERKYKDRSKDLDLICDLAQDNPGITFTEIDKELEFPKGTAKRLCEKLKENERIKIKGSKCNKVYIPKKVKNQQAKHKKMQNY